MKKVAIVIIAVVALWATFVGGRKSGYQESVHINNLRIRSVTALNAMATYDSASEAVKAIADKKESKALCTLQVSASANVSIIKECLNDSQCKSLIESEVQKVAPELLGNGALKIKYFAIGEKCVP